MSDDNETRDDQPAAAEPAAESAAQAPAGAGAGNDIAADDRAKDLQAAPRGGRAAFGLAFVALLIGAIATAASAWLWLQYRTFGDDLAGADREQRVAIEATDERLSRLTGELEALEREISDDRDRIAALRLEIGDFPRQIGDMARRIDALQGGGPADGREIWLEAEAEYYLAVANSELALTGRVGNAATALELADGLLRQLANPALNPVRVAIAEELAALRATELPDYEGIAIRLAGLAGRVPSLPVRGGRADSYADESAGVDDMEPGLGRLWASLRGAVLGIVRVERRDAPVEVLLTAAEQEMVRRELMLELQLARIALLRGEQAAFRASLEAAAALIGRDFDVDAGSVAAALDELRQMSGLDIAPPRPDISGSLNLLRATIGGAG